MLKSSDIFYDLESSTLVSYLYGLIRHIFYTICVAPFCNFTVPLVKQYVFTNGPIHGV